MPELQDNDILVKVAYVAQNPTGEFRIINDQQSADLSYQTGSTSSSGENPRRLTDVTFPARSLPWARTCRMIPGRLGT